MKVVQFMRKPNGIVFSIEQLFEDVRRQLPSDISVETYTNPYPSKGLWPRFVAMVQAIWHQGDINHITGDVHFLSILLRRRKTILTIHDCVTLERLGGLKYQVFRFLWYWLPAKRSAILTVISLSTKDELLRHLGKGGWRIEVIPDCVSSEFEFSEKEFYRDCPVILQVGTTVNKNIERVSAALEGMNCKLVIIGKLATNQIAALEKNGIHYENHVGISRHDLVDHYRNCDFIIFASLYEGFGLPILEAQAIGRPVITSNLYSMPEVGGDGACYVDPYNITEIRNAVERIVNDSVFRKNLISAGRENAEKYLPSKIASLYGEVYREVYAAGTAENNLAE
jgi:glycosyltransferase involved in cell wall biosynthesis